MKTCKYCGAQLKDDAKFCISCGRPVEESQNTQYSSPDAAYSGQSYSQQNSYQGYGQQANPGNSYQNSGYQPYNPAPSRTSGIAIASLVLGLVGIFTGFWGAVCAAGSVIISSYMGLAVLCFLPSILAILFGFVGIAKTGHGSVKGRGMAIAGLVLGIVFLIVWLIFASLARDTMGYSIGIYNFLH